MSNLTDAQAKAATNAHADAADDNNTGSVAVPSPAASIAQTETFVSGTAKVLDAAKDRYLYINITTAAALAVAMGPTSSANTVPVSISQSSALGVITVRVPRGWYVKLTGTVADQTCTSVAVV